VAPLGEGKTKRVPAGMESKEVGDYFSIQILNPIIK
jgi:hypothetical protein